jgi:ubiquinone/menaquinone biosynthesis C-methylase UbiE
MVDRVQPLRWVRETSFGTWFLCTSVWESHVVRVAITDLQRLMGQRPDRYASILDVGCGRGIALPLLDERFTPERIVGVDVDPESLERAKRLSTRCRCRVDLVQGHAERLELADGSMDMVFCHQTFHHLCDQESALGEFWRVLRPGGVLLFSESCRKFIHSFLIRVFFRHPMDVQKTAGEYLEMLREAGFEVNPGKVSLPYLWWSRPDLGALEWFGRRVPQQREETMVNAVAVR